MKRTRFTISLLAMLSSLMANAGNNYVDLGLPSGLLWATCNLGASAPEEVGNYYAWGETSPKTFFSEDNYIYKDYPIGLSNISGTQYDAATAALGGTWRMPTREEIKELADNCTRSQTTSNGKVCMELTGPNGNKLIIARGGLGEQGTPHEDGYGLWSSTKNGSTTAYRAWEWSMISYSYRWQGIPIRPVTSQKPTETSNDIAINEENFPDENFRAFLKEQPFGEDGILTEEEINSISKINVRNKKIKSLEGVEYFTALDSLVCSFNQLTSLDVSRCTALTTLDCGHNQLTSIEVSKNSALKSLGCNYNKLASLDVSKNTALTKLHFCSNQLTSLDVSKNTALTSLDCRGNQLTNLDVSENTTLKELWCNGNQLTSLDVSKNTTLTEFECTDNQLTSLDVTKNAKLIHLHCYKNQLQSLDVSKENTSLIDLSCYSNQINKEAMDHLLNNLPQQEDANLCVIAPDSSEGNVCTKTQVSSAKEKGWNVYAHIDYKDVEYEGSGPIENDIIINEENFPDENFRNFLLNESYGRDGIITDEEILSITHLGISNKGISDLKGIEYFKALTYLECSYNPLTGLDVSNNTALSVLMCIGNTLTSLDVSKNTALTYLECFYNQLTSLNVSNSALLTILRCNNNQLKELDLSSNIALTELICSNCQLESLDVSKNTALTYLECFNNQLSSIILSNNTALRRLECYNNQIKDEAMDALVGNLPQQDSAQLVVIDLTNSSEGNICTEAQVNVAKGKGWNVSARRNSGSSEYEGADLIVEIDGIYYNLNTSDNTAKVTQHISHYSGDIDIPATIKYNEVTYNVTAIGNYAFRSNISSIIIPNTVTSIGEYAFSYCSLTSIDIPNNVNHIGKGAFEGCRDLTSILLPPNLTAIEEELFRDCYNLNSIVIPDAVITIGKNAFSNCPNLSSVHFPSTLTSIDEGAFGGCTNLSSISLPDSLISIGRSAFDWCIALSSIIIPENVTSIEYGAFSGCSSLTSVIIPNSVTTIGYCAFASCTGLTSIKVEERNSVYDSRDNCNAIIKKADNELIAGCSKTIIPNTVISIGESAFYGQSDLTSIEIPSSVVTIGSGAFNFCSGLTSIVIPYSVTTIDDNPFYSCSSLKSIKVDDNNSVYDSRENSNAIIETATNELIVGCASTIIPNNVTSIGNLAFINCISLTSIDIPNSVTAIGDFAFASCVNLSTLNLGNGVKSIGSYAFGWCNSLTSLVIPNSVESIGDQAFVTCENLTSLVIPNSVTSVGNYAFTGNRGLKSLTVNMPTIDGYTFYGCDNLATITIGKDVNSIIGGFMGCSSITTVVSQSQTPPSCSGYTFESKVYSQATLKVPEGSKTSYQMADSWKKFMSIEEFEPTSIQMVIWDQKNNTLIYDLNGRRLKEPRKGINIVGGKKVLVK